MVATAAGTVRIGIIAGVEIREVRLGDPVTVPLISGLTEEYQRRYGAGDEMATTRDEEFDPPDGGFLVLLDGTALIAGGGIRRVSAETCEVKRMWTAPEWRRQGHAAVVLRALEHLGRRLGYRRIVLETGPEQPEAQALYASTGYTRTAVYGRYPSALAFERHLDADDDDADLEAEPTD